MCFSTGQDHLHDLCQQFQTHLYLMNFFKMDFFNPFIRKVHFQKGPVYIFFSNAFLIVIPKQTVKTQILRHLMWVYTICHVEQRGCYAYMGFS